MHDRSPLDLNPECHSHMSNSTRPPPCLLLCFLMGRNHPISHVISFPKQVEIASKDFAFDSCRVNFCTFAPMQPHSLCTNPKSHYIEPTHLYKKQKPTAYHLFKEKLYFWHHYHHLDNLHRCLPHQDHQQPQYNYYYQIQKDHALQLRCSCLSYIFVYNTFLFTIH